MKRLFRVGEDVFATVNYFEPFPAVVESIRLNEAECSVYYYVRLQGASVTIPLSEESLQPWEENKHKFKWKYSDKDLKRETQLRLYAVLGAQDEIPEVLMNFVTVDSDFEEVSDEAVKRLGLCSIMLTPSMVDCLEEKMSPRRGKKAQQSDREDDFIDVEDTDGADGSYPVSRRKKKSTLNSSWRRTSKNSISFKPSNSFNRRSVLKRSQNKWKSGEKVCPKKQISSVETIDLENCDKNEYANPFNSHWGGRLASGSYPCSMCFRKFRSKGEAHSHMLMHKPKLKQSEPDIDFSESEDSSSTKYDPDDRVSLHNSLERQRRAEMAARFQQLQDALDLSRGTSKQVTLATAKSRIEELEIESEEQDKEIACLQETNAILKSRYFELNPAAR